MPCASDFQCRGGVGIRVGHEGVGFKLLPSPQPSGDRPVSENGAVGFAPNGYYSFERLDGDGWDGLVRVSGDGNRFDDGLVTASWFNDQDLAFHFIEPGIYSLEAVDDATVQKLAERYGITL